MHRQSMIEPTFRDIADKLVDDGLADGSRGRNEKARRRFLSAWLIRPEDPEVLHLLGVSNHHLGNLGIAARAYKLATIADVEHPEASTALTDVLRTSGQCAEALAEIDAQLTRFGNNQGLILARADTLSELGRYEDAIEEYLKAQSMGADTALCFNNLGGAYLEVEEINLAQAAFRCAVARSPENPVYRYNLGLAFRHAGQNLEAQTAFQQALCLDPDLKGAQCALSTVLAAQNQQCRALEWLKRLVRMHPDFWAGHLTLGTMLMTKGDTLQARKSLHAAYELSGGNLATGLSYSEALLETDALNDALEVMSELRSEIASARTPATSKIVADEILAETLYRLGRSTDAKDVCCSIIRQYPERPSPYQILGHIAFDREFDEDAISNYQYAIKLNPLLNHARTQMASALQRRGRMDEAMLETRQAILLFPESANAQAALGNIFADRIEVRDATRHFHRSLMIDPDDGNAIAGLACLFNEVGYVDQSSEILRQKFTTDGTSPTNTYNFGVTLHALGRDDASLPLIEVCVANNPDDLRYLPLLGMLYNRIGATDQTIYHLLPAIDAIECPGRVFLELGDAYSATGDIQAAIRTWTLGLNRFPVSLNEPIDQKAVQHALLHSDLLLSRDRATDWSRRNPGQPSETGSGSEVRYDREHPDLYRAIDILKMTLRATASFRSERSECLNLLVQATLREANVARDPLATLNDAVSFARELQLTQPSASSFETLGDALERRFALSSDLKDLQQAAEAWSSARARLHPKATKHGALAARILSTFQYLSDQIATVGDLARLRALIGDVLDQGYTSQLEESLIAVCSTVSTKLEGDSSPDLDDIADLLDTLLDIRHEILLSRTDYSDRERWLRTFHGLGPETAWAFLNASESHDQIKQDRQSPPFHGRAVRALEKSQAVLFGQDLSAETISLMDIAESGHSAMASAYADALDAYRSASQPPHSRKALGHYERSNETATAWRKLKRCAEDIRTLPGYEEFLRPPSLDRIHAAAKAAPICYLASVPNGGLACFVDTERVFVIRLPAFGSHAIDEHLQPCVTIHDALKTNPTWSAFLDWRSSYEALGRFIWDACMGSVLTLAADQAWDRMVFVPIGADVAMLNLQSAWTWGTTGKPRYAIQDLSIAYAPSAMTLRHRSALETDTLGKIVFSKSWAAEETQSHGATSMALERSLQDLFPPNVLHSIGVSTATKTAPNDVLDLLSKLSRRDHVIWYHDGHGVADPSDPLRSGILFPDGTSGMEQSPRLTTSAMLRTRDLSIDAVVAACEAATHSTTTMHDESLSFASALLRSGCSSVTAPNWVVDSEATCRLLTAHAAALAGSSKADPAFALTLAQRHMIEAAEPIYPAPPASTNDDAPPILATNDPIAWAPFSYSGGFVDPAA